MYHHPSCHHILNSDYKSGSSVCVPKFIFYYSLVLPCCCLPKAIMKHFSQCPWQPIQHPELLGLPASFLPGLPPPREVRHLPLFLSKRKRLCLGSGVRDPSESRRGCLQGQGHCLRADRLPWGSLSHRPQCKQGSQPIRHLEGPVFTDQQVMSCTAARCQPRTGSG